MLLLVFFFQRLLFLTVSKLEIRHCVSYLAITPHWRESEYIFNGVILPCYCRIKILEVCYQKQLRSLVNTAGVCFIYEYSGMCNFNTKSKKM